MSARIPARRIGRSALTAVARPSTFWISSPTLRHASTTPKSSDTNTIMARYLQKQEDIARRGKDTKRPQIFEGTLARETTIFSPDYEIAGYRDSLSAAEKASIKKADEEDKKRREKKREAELMAYKLDPNPAARMRWERKMVIRGVTRRGRLTHDVKLARTERQSLWKSRDLPTSTKKLGRIMEMVKGKTVEEAMVQLRFSKKRVARDVLKGLMIARDEAVVARGMGLGYSGQQQGDGEMGVVKMEDGEVEKEGASKKLSAKERQDLELLLPDGTRRRTPTQTTPTTIELKDGKHKKVFDPTEIYVDQAWVGKGEQWKSPEFRARGRINMLTHRSSSFSVILKEEKTRMRISEEIKKKREIRKLWTALPDRVVTAQRQYVLW